MNVKKIFLLMLVSALSLCVLLSCAKKADLTHQDIVGIWNANVTAAEYIVLEDGGTYQMYNEDGEARGSGNYILDGSFVVLDGTSKNDDEAIMVLAYKDENTLHYKGAIVDADYKRASEVPTPH